MYLSHHDERILPIVLVVAAAQGGGPEAGPAVQLLCREIRGSHLEGDPIEVSNVFKPRIFGNGSAE